MLDIRTFPDRAAAGAAAATEAAHILRETLNTQATARVIFAAAPSQRETLQGLVEAEGIDWARVTAFHMDEYLEVQDKDSFAAFLHTHLWRAVKPGTVHVITPGDDPEAECDRYAALVREAPIDLVCLGIGDNGHLAFNDPPVADFHDPRTAKVVELDAACRTQQVGDGCFGTLAEVPTHAVTLTIPALMSARRLVATVPGPGKRAALRAAVNGP